MRMIAFFQTLRGKLILTYTLVTVLALLALEITLLILISVFSRGIYTDTISYLSDVISVLPPQARPYLQPGARDISGLQDWLQVTYENGYASLPPQGILDDPAAPIVKSQPMYVISPDGTILAAVPTSAKSMIGKKFSPPADVKSSQDVLASAMALDLQVNHLAAIRPGGSYWMAVPVQQNQREGPLAAIILLTVQGPPPGIKQWLPMILWVVPLTGLLLLLAVAPFGALFGLIMSRGLTRRLGELTRAADAWSEGDFSVHPQDRSKDEISFLGMRMRRMAEHIQTLLQTQRELALMEERNRLARELHDTVKQETFATLMQVRAAKNLLDRDPSAARERLDAAEELIKTSQQELGLLISELRPADLASAVHEGNRGLASALNDYLATWSQHSRIPTDLHVQHERRLPLEVEQTLFRVAQEALSNIARHSRASAASIHLTYDPAQVTLCITDNGIGFDSDAAGSGFGLLSMHDRMSAIQGSLQIQSNRDGGTTVTASAPALRQEQK